MSKTDLRCRHGFSSKSQTGGRHPLYNVWAGMVRRCHTATRDTEVRYYRARGIWVCPEWRFDAGAFCRWGLANGWAPGLQIDRRDNDGPYAPWNCRFVTPKVNANNKRTYRHGVNRVLPAGVVPHNGGFKAQLREGSRMRFLGKFATPEEAHAAFLVARADRRVRHGIDSEADRPPAQSAYSGVGSSAG